MTVAMSSALATLPRPVSSRHVQSVAETILRTAKVGERDPKVLERVALLEFQISPRLPSPGRKNQWPAAGFVQSRSAPPYLRRRLPKNSLSQDLSLARLARWSATTLRSTQLPPPSHGRAAEGRLKLRLRRLDTASRCRQRRGRYKEFPHARSPLAPDGHTRKGPPTCPIPVAVDASVVHT
jgi:hypothetical protein